MAFDLNATMLPSALSAGRKLISLASLAGAADAGAAGHDAVALDVDVERVVGIGVAGQQIRRRRSERDAATVGAERRRDARSVGLHAAGSDADARGRCCCRDRRRRCPKRCWCRSAPDWCATDWKATFSQSPSTLVNELAPSAGIAVQPDTGQTRSTRRVRSRTNTSVLPFVSSGDQVGRVGAEGDTRAVAVDGRAEASAPGSARSAARRSGRR